VSEDPSLELEPELLLGADEELPLDNDDGLAKLAGAEAAELLKPEDLTGLSSLRASVTSPLPLRPFPRVSCSPTHSAKIFGVHCRMIPLRDTAVISCSLSAPQQAARYPAEEGRSLLS
jgi:hypothetical protein